MKLIGPGVCGKKKNLMNNFISFIVLRVLDFLFVNLLCFCKLLICVFNLFSN